MSSASLPSELASRVQPNPVLSSFSEPGVEQENPPPSHLLWASQSCSSIRPWRSGTEDKVKLSCDPGGSPTALHGPVKELLGYHYWGERKAGSVPQRGWRPWRPIHTPAHHTPFHNSQDSYQKTGSEIRFEKEKKVKQKLVARPGPD